MNQSDILNIALAFFSGLGVWLFQLVLSRYLKRRLKYDVFISYPMKGLYEDKQRIILGETVKKIKTKLEQDYQGIRVFSSMDDRQEEGKRFIDETRSFSALRASKCFILIYPERVSSSVLLEAGYAIALDKISVFIAKNNRDLPYLIHANAPFNKNIYLFEYCNIEDLPDFTSKILSNFDFIKKFIDGSHELKL
jgi:hypothetical protein